MRKPGHISLSLILLFAAASSPAFAADAKREALGKILDSLAQLQYEGTWVRSETRQMMGLLRDAHELGLKLPVDDVLVQRQNRLVQNMHDYLSFSTQHMVQGEAAMIRIGKQPGHPEFAGLSTARPSDFDVTYAGRAEAAAKQAHIKLAESCFGEDFAAATRLVIAEADATLGARSLGQVKDLFNKVALRPDLHRTYSGLRFVDDYILETGSVLSMQNGKLVRITRAQFGNADEFARAINRQLEAVGSSFRMGGWQRGFALGQVSDIVRQIEINVNRGALAHLVKKKCIDRYLKALNEVGENIDALRITQLRTLADTNPSAFIPAFGKFEREVVQKVASAQRAAYNEALRSGLSGRAELILADSTAAIYHFEKHGYKAVAKEGLEEVGDAVMDELRRNPYQDVGEFLVETGFERLPPGVRFFDNWSITQYLKAHPVDAAIRVGGWLYTAKTLWDAGTCGDDSKFNKALVETAASVALYDGIPLAMSAMGMSKAAAAYGTISFATMVGAIAFKATGDYIVNCIKSGAIEQKGIRAFCGVDSQGKETGIGCFMDELGVPLTQEDLDAAKKIELGTFNNGKLIIRKDEGGNFAFHSLRSSYHEDWDAGKRDALEGWMDERTSWQTVALSPGQIVGQHRMRRVYDKLRREYLDSQGGRSRQPKDLATEIYLPELGTHIANEGLAMTTDEFAFFRRRFNEAWDSAAAQWARKTSSTHLEINEAIKRSAIATFAQQMMRYARENEQASDYYDNMTTEQLQFWLDTGIPIRFDGRDVPAAEIRARLEAGTTALLSGEDAARQAWLLEIRGNAGDTTGEDELLDEGWYVLKHELVHYKDEMFRGKKEKVRETWYAPKKARSKVKRKELLEAAVEKLQEKARNMKAISCAVTVFQGPFESVPRDIPPAKEEIIAGEDGS
ncbi:MAG: hypothetical protein V2A76_17310 [Planctomycetota bacterium]